MKILIFGSFAPMHLTEAPQECRENWWHQVSQLVHDLVRQADLLIMIDANARSGPNDQSHVFDNDDISNVNTGLFREFLAEHDLCAPATLTLHEGENTTWLHPKEDSEYRIEYVLVPMQWREHCSKSCSLDHLDLDIWEITELWP